MADITIIPYAERSETFYQERADHLFYAPAWIQVMTDTYGFRFFTALNTETNDFIIFALVDRPVGPKIVSLPFSDYTLIDLEQAAPLLTAIRQAYPTVSIVLRVATGISAPAVLGEPVRQAYYHRVDTTPSDTTERQLSGSFRRGVRKAQKAGVQVQQSYDQEALREFYVLYHQLRIHKFESIPQPYVFFEQVWEKFIRDRQGFILQARREGQMIAAIVVLRHKNVWYYKFGCSAMDSLEHRPNNLLFAELIRMATETAEIDEIDLGLSGTGESYAGLVRFKESMGGQRLHITYYEQQPTDYDPGPEKAFKAMLSSLTEVMVQNELDIQATDQFSQIIYPYFL